MIGRRRARVRGPSNGGCLALPISAQTARASCFTSGKSRRIAFIRRARPCNARKVGLIIQKEHNVPKEELLEFEGLVTEILPESATRTAINRLRLGVLID